MASTDLSPLQPGGARETAGSLGINATRPPAASESNSRRWAGISRLWSAGYAAALLSLCCVVLVAPAFAQSEFTAYSSPAQQLPEGYFSFVGDVVAQLGERYGGGWITWEGDVPTEHVGVVNPTSEEIAEIVAQAPAGLAVEVVPVRYSKQQLDGYVEQLGAIAASHGGEVVMVGPRSELNKVEVVVTAKDLPVVDEMRTAIPEDALLITIDPDAAFSTLPGRPRSGPAWPVVLISVAGLAGVATLLVRRAGGVRRTSRLPAAVPSEPTFPEHWPRTEVQSHGSTDAE
jgi:hypothetical protein